MNEGKMEGLKKYHGERYKEVFYAWNDIWLDKSFKHWDISKYLPNIKSPLLVIQGKDDQYGTLKQVETIADMASAYTESYTPSNCGHAPFKEQPARVLEKVVNFIRNHGS